MFQRVFKFTTILIGLSLLVLGCDSDLRPIEFNQAKQDTIIEEPPFVEPPEEPPLEEQPPEDPPEEPLQLNGTKLVEALAGDNCRFNGSMTIKVCEDIVYDILDSNNPASDLKLDLYVPNIEITEPLPLIIWVHGGGWRNGSRRGCGRANTYADEGFVVACVTYRLTQENVTVPGEVIPAAVFPAQIQDVRTAVRFLRQNSNNIIDPNRFVAWGSSAGGHLVSLLGTSGNDATLDGRGDRRIGSHVHVVIDFYGPTDLHLFLRPDGSSSIPNPEWLVGGEPGLVPSVLLDPAFAEKVEQADPVTWLDPEDPPVLLVHGTEDRTVPIASSQYFYDALQELAISSRYIILPGAAHGGPIFDQLLESDYADAVSEFISQHLSGD